MKNLIFVSIIVAVIFAGCKKDKDSEINTTLSVSNNSLFFSAADEAVTFDVKSNRDWTLTGHESVSWITVSPVSGTGNVTVNVKAEINSLLESRSAELTLTAQGATPVKVNIFQQAMAELKLTSFSPVTAGFGTTLSIKGEKFNPTPEGNMVKINGITVEVLSATSSEIKVTVPKNMNCSGLVEVITDGQTVVSETIFTYMLTCTVSTLAGNGVRGFSDGVGASAQFNNPLGIAVDVSGNVYVADNGNQRIRKITPEGVVSTLAGSGTSGYADGESTEAQFSNPAGVAVDASGNVYVADRDNYCIRKINADGHVSTIVGNGKAGFANGAGDAAQFDTPCGIAVDASGNLFVADLNNHRIRKINPEGMVSVLAGSGEAGFFDASSTLALFNYPIKIAVDNSGNIYVTDMHNHCIRKISPTGDVSTVAGNGMAGFLDSTDGEAQFRYPKGVAVNAFGHVYVADESNNCIRHINPSGVVTTIVSRTGGFADGTGDAARFNRPYCLAVDALGVIYVADLENQRIRKIVAE